MESKKIVEICEEVLTRLSIMDYERAGGTSTEQLIFPVKNGGDDRISEQELRFLFVEEFKKEYSADSNKLYYSVETPTVNKYKFGKDFNFITGGTGRSASIDMSVYKNVENSYNRILNIEFKYDNVPILNIGKDILKLRYEKQNGVFIHLLKNTGSGTLYNSNERGKGVFNKYKESFKKFECDDWSSNDKSIQLVIISLEQNALIYNKIKKDSNLDVIFDFDDKFGDITEVKERNGWKTVTIGQNANLNAN